MCKSIDFSLIPWGKINWEGPMFVYYLGIKHFLCMPIWDGGSKCFLG